MVDVAKIALKTGLIAVVMDNGRCHFVDNGNGDDSVCRLGERWYDLVLLS